MSHEDIVTLVSYVETNARENYLKDQEILEFNIQKRAFDLFPDSLTHEQERIIQRSCEETLRACNSMCVTFSYYLIDALTQILQDETKD